MTSRERINETLNHRQPEGLAIDFGAMRSTGIHIQAYVELTKALNLHLSPTKLYDVFQQLALPHPEVIDLFGGDVMQAHQRCPAFGISIEQWRDDVLDDGTPIMVPRDYQPVPGEDGLHYIYENGVKVAARPAVGLYYDIIAHPFKGAETIDDIDRIKLEPMSEQDLDFIEQEVQNLYEQTDKAILLAFGGNIFETGQMSFGYEDFYVNILAEPDLMHYFFNKIAQLHLKNLKALMPRVAPYSPIIQFGDDLGTQINAQISVETYREMIKPYHACQYQYIQNNYPNCKVFLHCCGAIASLIPDLIDAGVQVLNPVQLSARGMDPRMLKKEFGRALSFWGGGADTSRTMTQGTVRDNIRETDELIGIFAPGGGYVFTQVHNIQPNVPVENIINVYETALKYR